MRLEHDYEALRIPVACRLSRRFYLGRMVSVIVYNLYPVGGIFYLESSCRAGKIIGRLFYRIEIKAKLKRHGERRHRVRDVMDTGYIYRSRPESLAAVDHFKFRTRVMHFYVLGIYMMVFRKPERDHFAGIPAERAP